MGYGGKVAERQRARELRSQSWTLAEIARELGVSKSSVSVWVRDVEFTPKPRNRGHRTHKPHPMHLAKLAEIERCRVEAAETIGELSEREFLMFGLALYAGDGSKTSGEVRFTNSSPVLIQVFLAWFRRFFEVDERRLRVRLYLHDGLDLEAAQTFWRDLTGIPIEQFTTPYRARADSTIRRTKHVNGCASVGYSCTLTLRRVLALIEAVSSGIADPG